MNGIKEIQLTWDSLVKGKTITQILYDDVSIVGFLLNDGTKVGYDYKTKGLFISTTADGSTEKYH